MASLTPTPAAETPDPVRTDATPAAITAGVITMAAATPVALSLLGLLAPLLAAGVVAILLVLLVRRVGRLLRERRRARRA